MCAVTGTATLRPRVSPVLTPRCKPPARRASPWAARDAQAPGAETQGRCASAQVRHGAAAFAVTIRLDQMLVTGVLLLNMACRTAISDESGSTAVASWPRFRGLYGDGWSCDLLDQTAITALNRC